MQVSTPFKKVTGDKLTADERNGLIVKPLNKFRGDKKHSYIPCPYNPSKKEVNLDPLINMVAYRLNFYMYRGTRAEKGGGRLYPVYCLRSYLLSVTGRGLTSASTCAVQCSIRLTVGPISTAVQSIDANLHGISGGGA